MNRVVRICSLLAAGALGWAPPVFCGPPDKQIVFDWIDGHQDELHQVNQKIWTYAETSLEEHRSSGALVGWLRANGFVVEEAVAGMPTAFVASYGSGSPILGFLAEYDALPGLSQQAVPEPRPREGVEAGHGCGHSVFGTASTGAAIAVKQFLAQRGVPGTVRLYGTPAEETGIGKTFMLRAGLFDDADVIFSWHAMDRTGVSFNYTKALVSAKFTFRGLAAHASTSPYMGRSALDGVELMDVGANYLREHLKEDARIHYVITHGGGQPNVVPPEAQVWYYLRADKHYDVESYFARLEDIARGAALMSGTEYTMEVETDHHEVLPNRPLSEVIQRNLELVGPPPFDDADRAFARKTQEGLSPAPPHPLSETIDPMPAEPGQHPASTDVGDLSWKVPVGRLYVATYSLGAPGHSWQIAACTGTSIGEKGMLVAARALAASAVDVYLDPAIAVAARKDLEERRTAYPFVSLLPPDREAPRSVR